MKIKFIFWQEAGGKYLGYLNEFPDYWTQGETLEDLKTHLWDLQGLLSDGELVGVRHESEVCDAS